MALFGNVRPYFNFNVQFDVNSLEEKVHIHAARDDEEPVSVGDRHLKVRDLVNLEPPYRVNKYFNLYDNEKYVGRVRIKASYSRTYCDSDGSCNSHNSDQTKRHRRD